MLKLERKHGQKVIIRVGDIAIHVVVMRDRGKTWLGITAPQEIEINREEVDREKHPESYAEMGKP